MNSDMLRFMTCGNVDDGKSTLIGRLLHDSGQIFQDQPFSSGASRHYASLLDGLLAERERGITIDVAYRHFTTAKRRFMVADAPGHTEYLPGMITAASNVEAAILLADISRGLALQTRRHAAILHLLGVEAILLAINKMDLVNYREGPFREMEAQFRDLALGLGFANAACIPVCALNGDNVAQASGAMSWFKGPRTFFE